MRAVVKVKPMGGKGASRVARYIAESKLDPTREGERRPLFSDREDDLARGDDRTYRKADQHLTEGRGAPPKKDLIHFSVSFREEDFERLGANYDERRERLREATREAMAEIQTDLNVARWKWIAGIHLNTPHPHVHIVIHKMVTDSKTTLPRRLGNLPKRMLPHSKRDSDGAIRSVDGGVAGRFIAALERAQERVREAERAREERVMALRPEQAHKESEDRWISRLLDAASRNPSLAGRDLVMEIISRGPEPEPGERLNPVGDIQAALRHRSLDDSDYQTQIEQASELSKHSKLLRDLYERGADVKGATLVIPGEEHEVPGERDHIRVIAISHAFEKFRDDPKTAVEFHSLARAIAGETADTRTEIEVFKRYYDLIERDADGRRLDRHGDDYERERAAALDRTLREMRLLAGEMAKLETRESIDIVPSIAERSYVYRHIQDYEHASEFHSLAQAIAGPEADLQKETLVFSYYYGKLERDGAGHRLTPDNEARKLEAVERTLAEMRLAVEQKAELPEYVIAPQAIASLDEAPGREGSPDDEEEDPFTDNAADYDADYDSDDLDGPEYEYTLEEAYGDREAESAAWQFNTSARKVNLSGERLRFPVGLTATTREWLVEMKLPEIDRRIENGASLYDKRDHDGSILEKGILSDANRLIRPERDEMLRRVSEAAGFAWYDDEARNRPPDPNELAEARRILIELCADEKGEMERRHELRLRLETSDKSDPGEGRSRVVSDRSYVFNDQRASRLARIERLIEGIQKSLGGAGAGQADARHLDSRLYVSLSNDKAAPSLPVANIRVYDAIEKMATGAKLQLSTRIGKDGPALISGFTEKEYDYRVKVAGFLKSYVHERLRDPETRLIHDNEIFRNAYKALNQARTPEELDRVAYDIMSRNERQGMPLEERERWLLFNGRSPDHYTPEMEELRLAWGLPREEREQAMRDGRLPVSPAFKAMLDELESRRNVESARQYQKALMTPPEEMRNPGRLPLYEMHKKLLGHERDYIYHLAEEMKKRLPGKERSVRADAKGAEEATRRAFGKVPQESRSYKEYIAALGEIKGRLLEEAASRSGNDAGVINFAEQVRIHNRACDLTWERLATEEVFSSQPSEPARRLSDTIAKLQHEAQPRARLAAQALDEFGKENIPSYTNGRVHRDVLDRLELSIRERYEQLKDFAGRSREELYRGFEAIDGLRQEIEKSRADELMNDRVALGNAIVAEARYECARLDYERARDYGETFRFRIRDESLQANRRISAFDVERRADARGVRAAGERGAERAEDRRGIRQEVSALDLANHAETLREHGVIHNKLINKLEVEAERAANERLLAQERAQEITTKYQERGAQLPVPFINRKTLTTTQEQTVRRRLTGHTETLEQIRVAQLREFNRPARTDAEAARLRAQLFVARTDLQASEERASRFDRTRHLRQWEIGGEKWSLADVDRRLERLSDEAQIFGRYQLHLNGGDRKSAKDEIGRLTAIREEIVARTAEQRGGMRNKVGEAGKLVEILSQAHERESERRAQTGKEMPEPKFTRDEFERIADNAATTRDAAMLRHVYGFDGKSNSYADPKEIISPERMIARALGRETMAEVFLHESAERLSNFHDRKEVQPLLIEMPDGQLITHRFKDTKPRSLLERITRPLVEAPAEREMREAVQTALQHQERQLAGDLEKSRAYYEAAREMANSISLGRNNGGPVSLPAPEFSPKEEMNIEIYAERLTDEGQREHYLGLLDPERGSRPSSHASTDKSDHSREAATLVPEAPAIGVGRGR
jgi:relaxase-like protein